MPAPLQMNLEIGIFPTQMVTTPLKPSQNTSSHLKKRRPDE